MEVTMGMVLEAGESAGMLHCRRTEQRWAAGQAVVSRAACGGHGL